MKIRRKYIVLTLVVCLLGSIFTACGKSEKPKVIEGPNPIVTINFKDYGKVEIELYKDKAPNTVNNFISLINNKFYDGLTFHRIIKDFMIQGGDPNGTGTGGPGYSINGEFTSNKFEGNDIKHEPGVISMARSQDKNSGGSQFFIMTSENKGLDGQYAAFGKVISGMDIVYEISKVETDSKDKPIVPVVIESIAADTKGVDYPQPVKVK